MRKKEEDRESVQAHNRLAKVNSGIPGAAPLANPRYRTVGRNPQWKAVLPRVMILLSRFRASGERAIVNCNSSLYQRGRNSLKETKSKINIVLLIASQYFFSTSSFTALV